MSTEVKPIIAPPTPAELQSRLDNVRRLMQREGVRYYIAAHTDNVYYLTNFAYIPFERPFFLIIAVDAKPTLIVPELEVSHAEAKVLLDVDYKTYYEYPAPAGQTYVDALTDFIPAHEKVGIESSLPVAHQGAIPSKTIIADIIDEARLVKSEYEIGRIAYAASVVDEGLGKALELSKSGTQELTIYSEGVRHMMGKVLLENPDANLLVSKFICAVWPKSISAQPHSHPGIFDTLEDGGPNVSIVTAQADGYSAEVERTFFIGNMPEEAKGPFETIMEARALAYGLIKPGASADEVDTAVLDLIKKRGYGDCILHRTGHGFGITGHEPPWVARGSAAVLEKNMVVSIEPGVYIPGKGGYRHSDTVLVTAEGCMSLTKAPDQLEALILK